MSTWCSLEQSGKSLNQELSQSGWLLVWSAGDFLHWVNWGKNTHPECGWSHFIGWTLEYIIRRKKLNTGRYSFILLCFWLWRWCNLSSCLDFPTMMGCNLELTVYWINPSHVQLPLPGYFITDTDIKVRHWPSATEMETTVTKWRQRGQDFLLCPVSHQPRLGDNGLQSKQYLNLLIAVSIKLPLNQTLVSTGSSALVPVWPN